MYGGKGVAGQFGCEKMHWKLVFINGFMYFFEVQFLVKIYACVNFVTFESLVGVTGNSPHPCLHVTIAILT